jgi:hypothetical protein
MAEKFNITGDWVKLSDLITVENEKTYYVQNLDSPAIFVVESDTEPTEKVGMRVLKNETIGYEKGKELWLTCENNARLQNIATIVVGVIDDNS